MLNRFFFIFLFFYSFCCYSLPSNSIYNLNCNLTDKDGNVINIKELSGDIQVFSMIYTRCKTICPIIISNMKSIERALPKNILNNVKFTLITLDPDRDSISTLLKYFNEKKFNKYRWNLYKANKNDTLKIALSSGIKYKKEKDDEYTHSNLIIILDKSGVIKLHHQGLDKNYSNLLDLIKSLN